MDYSVKAKSVIGLKVFTIQEGKEIGSVKDVVYDPKQNRIISLLVGSNSLLPDEKVLNFDAIKSIGPDAVIIENANLLKKLDSLPKPVQDTINEGSELIKLKIVTEDGVVLGSVSDIYLDKKSGQVSELEVTQGGFRDIHTGKKRVRITDIITIGKDAAIVKDYVTEKVGNQEGGLKKETPRAIEKIRESSQDLLQKAETNLQKLSKRTRQEASSMRENPRVQAAYQQIIGKAYGAERKIRHSAKVAAKDIKKTIKK